MSPRLAIAACVAALAALGGWAVLRGSRASSTPPSASSSHAPRPAESSPSVVPVSKQVRARSPLPEKAENPTSLTEYRQMRERLGEAYRKAFQAGGAGAAYEMLLARIDGRPADEAARRDRVYAFRYLPAIAAALPSLREEILARLRRHLAEDADPEARGAAAATFADAPVYFTRLDEKTAYFWVAGAELPPGLEGADEQRLRAEGTKEAALRAELQSAFAKERDADVRLSLMELLAGRAEEDDRAFFQGALQSDADVQVREIAIEALGRLPASPESRKALELALQGAAEPELQRRALATLVRQGVVDDLVVSRLIGTPPSRETWDLLGRAWRVSQPPAIGAYLRSGLESPDPKIRAGSIASMAKSGDRSFLPFIEATRAKEKDPSVVALADKAAALLGSKP